MTDSKRIPFAETTSWSPCHIGRAKALVEAHPGMSCEAEATRSGDLVRLTPRAYPEDVYGSDLGAHLDLLAERERAK